MQMPFNTNLPLKQAIVVLFDLLQEIFKRIIKATRYFTMIFGFIIFYLLNLLKKVQITSQAFISWLVLPIIASFKY